MSGAASLIKTTIVQAGAGTGKTESLAKRIIDVAKIIREKKGDVPRFVATTFTERATSELRERVVSILTREPEAPAWLTEFVQDTEKLHISTIHGTLSLILHRFGSLLGLDPEFTIMSASDERDMLSRQIREIIAAKPELSFLLEHYAFRDLVDATRTLTSHFRLHGDAFRPANGWEEIFENQRKLLLDALADLSNADLTSMTPKLAEKIEELQKLRGPVEAASKSAAGGKPDYEQIRSVFLECVGEMRKPTIKENGKGAEVKPAVDFIFELKKDYWSTNSYDPLVNRRHDEVAKALTELVRLSSARMQEEKREEGQLTFDDLEFLTLELIEKHPASLASIRREWDYWFVDEFQDTSPLQKKLLFQFFREPWNAYFVGDPQQSIYLFRGADATVFQDTKTLIASKQGEIDRLKTNYRSQPDLLEFMNGLFKSMRPPMEELEARDNPEGEVRAEFHVAGPDVSEDQLVLRQIAQWRDEGYSFHDMSVLVRTNDRARTVARHLSAAGVPVYVHSSGGYYDRREVLDALSLLSFIEDPSDDDTFAILARSPWVGVDDQILADWGVRRAKRAYWDWLCANPEEFKKVRTLDMIREAVVKAETRPLSTVFEDLVQRLGFMEFCLAGDASGRREANLRKLFFTLREAECDPGFSAAEFIDSAWRELVDTSEETEAASFIEPQRVNIMTIHKSKGLKFNCVILPNGSQRPRAHGGLLETAPDGRWAIQCLSVDSEERVSPIMLTVLKEERFERELEESSRVFYVGVTRAAERLSLIGKSDIQDRSWFSSIGLDLSEGTHEALGAGRGCYNVTKWTEDPEIPQLINDADNEEARPVDLPERLDHDVHRLTVTRLVAVRASELDHAAAKADEGAFRAGFEAQLESQQRGQAIHYVFEELKYNPQLGVKKLCDLARSRFPGRLKVEERLISRTLELSEPPLKKLIEAGFTEWPFLFSENGVALEGKVDLWGEVGGETWIVDYKSAEHFTDESIWKAREQLELYALAISKLGKDWNKIKLAVVAPLQAENVRVLSLSSKDDVVKRLKPLKVQSWAEVQEV